VHGLQVELGKRDTSSDGSVKRGRPFDAVLLTCRWRKQRNGDLFPAARAYSPVPIII